MDEIKEQMSMEEEKTILSEVTEDIRTNVDSLKEDNLFSNEKSK
jgi:hypothetical protein